MKDVTKEFFKQHKDYGKKVNLNLTRVDIYVGKVRNIYRVLGRENLPLKIIFGKTVTRSFPANVGKASQTVREYGMIYFLEINYPNTRDAVHIRLKDLVPGGLEKVRKEKEKDGCRN